MKITFSDIASVGFIYITEREKFCLDQDLNCEIFFGNQTYSALYDVIFILSSHIFIPFWLRKISVSAEKYQLSFRVFF